MADRGPAVIRVRPSQAWAPYVPAVPAGLCVLAAGAAFQRVFTWGDVAGPVTVAAVLGTAAGVAGRRLLTASVVRSGPSGDDPVSPPLGDTVPAPPRPAAYLLAGATVAAATLVSVLAAAVLFATPAAGLGSGVTRGVGALFHGWSRILTTSDPVPPTPDRLPLAAGLVTVAAAWAVLAASRRRPGVDALLPSGLVLLMALLLGVGGPGSLASVAGPPLVLAAVYLLMVSRPAGEGVVWVPPGRTVAALSTGAVVLAVALGVGSHLPLAGVRQPVDLRRAVSPPLGLGTAANPLDELPAWQKQGGTVMFTASVDQAWLRAPVNWRLVSLDVYDGTGWSTDAHASSAGNVLTLPPGVRGGLLGPGVRVSVHVVALEGPWVPTAGVPTSVTPAGLDFDPGSSALVAPPRSSGRYTLGGRLSEPSRAALDAAGIGSGASVAAFTAVPACFPASLRSLAASAAAGLARPDQQAVAVAQELVAGGGFRLDPGAIPGSSCARLSALSAAKSGTAEQFATAFALMVRSIGLPSRLAVGFTPGTIDRARATTVVTGTDATVWPEVDLGRLGWVAFDPNPSSLAGVQTGQGAGRTTPVPVAQQGLAQVQQTVANARSRASLPASRPTGSPEVRRQPAGGGPPWALIAVLAAAVIVIAVVGVRAVTRRRRRARRRAAADPVSRVLGAWSELLEALAPYRVPVDTLTPSEVSRRAAELVPTAAEASTELAGLVDRAVYAGEADDVLAARAWASSDVAVSAVVRATPAGLRVRELIVRVPGPPGRRLASR